MVTNGAGKPPVDGRPAPKPAAAETQRVEQQRPPAPGARPAAAAAAGSSWDRGRQQPQTNVTARPGQFPTGARRGGDRPVPGTPTPDRSVREEARTKAAVIDGPTRKVERNELPVDMPDLSEVRHPTPTAAEPEAQRVAAVAGPVAVPSTGPLRAVLQLRRIDPWSALKLSLVISVAGFLAWMVAVAALYLVLGGMGVWDRLNSAFTDIVSDTSGSGLVTAGQVFGYSSVIGLINIVLFTAIVTIGSFIYNLCADLVGGVEVTLADRD